MADLVEWAADAIELMGISVPFHPADPLTRQVYNYRTTLPVDFFSLDYITYDDEVLGWGERINAATSIGSNIYSSSTYDTGEETVSGVQVYQTRQMNSNSESEEYFFIEGNYIKTSFEEGEIVIHYKAFPVDSEGLPMVPQNISSMKALSWYVVSMLLQRGESHPTINYDRAYNMWLRYCSQGANDLMFPSVEKMEYLKERWLNTIRHDSN